MASPSGESTTFAYDGFLRKGITWMGPVSGSLSLGFDNNFRVTSQAVNGSSLSFGYDPDGLMTQAGSLSIVPDTHNGRLTGTTLGNLTDAYTYDANGLLASYTASFSGTMLYQETIGQRDNLGRITQKTDAFGSETHTWTYAYDATGRLTDAFEDGVHVSHYGYDADDNRTTYTTPGGTTTATYDVQDRLITYGGATYTYTANGELATKTDATGTTSYTYDALGNLLHVGLPSGTNIDYVVDGQGRRVGKKVNGTLVEGFLYQDHLRMVAQLDGSGNVVARFVFGSRPNVPDYMTTSAGTFRILSDHLGSPRLVVNTATDAVVERIDYDEFGNVLADTQPGFVPFGFAGGLYDRDTGFVRFGGRDYDGSVGRWAAKDPIRFRGGLNMYIYVANDPVDFVDPTGRDLAGAVAGCAAGAAGGALGAGEGGIAVCIPTLGGSLVCGVIGAAGGAIIGCIGGAIVGAGVPANSGGYSSSGDTSAPNSGGYSSSGDTTNTDPTCRDSSRDNSGDDDCDEQWRAAYEECGRLITDPNGRGGSNRRLAGGYTNLQDCARGLVSEECGGNPI